MEKIPLARASQIIQIARTLEAHGGSAERILAAARLPMWHLVRPDGLIPTRHIWLFMERAARAVGDPAFGHVVGENDPLGGLGALAAQIGRSPTLYRGLQTCCCQLHTHTSNTRCWLDETCATHVWLCADMGAIEIGLAEMEQCFLMQLIRIVRSGAGPGWQPTVVTLRAGGALGLEKTATLSEADIRYRQPVTAIAIPRAILARPLGGDQRREAPRQGASPTLYPTPAPADDLAESIRQLVGTWMYQEYPRIEAVAEAAGLHARALQRKLARDGLTYSELVEQVRFQIATRLLEDTEATVTDIAFDLGYTDVSHFSRAFHRWAGVSPSAYRRLSVAN